METRQFFLTLMFVSKDRSLTFEWSILRGRLQTHKHILNWGGRARQLTNTLPYYDMDLIASVKSFIVDILGLKLKCYVPQQTFLFVQCFRISWHVFITVFYHLEPSTYGYYRVCRTRKIIHENDHYLMDRFKSK